MGFPRHRSTACLAALLLAAFPAMAINDMFAKDAPVAKMTEEDFRVAGLVVQKALDDAADGETRSWENPATSASGSITPLARFERRGLPCRGAKFVITAGGTTASSEWVLCRTETRWKVAEGR
jgi:surface antigen